MKAEGKEKEVDWEQQKNSYELSEPTPNPSLCFQTISGSTTSAFYSIQLL